MYVCIYVYDIKYTMYMLTYKVRLNLCVIVVIFFQSSKTSGQLTDADIQSALLSHPNFNSGDVNTVFMIMFHGNLTYCGWSDCADSNPFCGWHAAYK